MSKVVWKFRPGDYYRIGEHESWFSDMAREGLHLIKMGHVFARFIIGEPKNIHYRIDVSKNKDISLEQKYLYAEGGWDFVASYGDFNVYSSSDEIMAPELHTDPAEQAYSLQELHKKLIKNVWIVVVYTVLMLVILSTPLWLPNGTFTLSLIEGSSILLPLVISILYLLYESISGLISLRRLRQELIEGKPINHHAPWKRQQRIKTTIAIVYILLVGYVIVMPFIQIAISKTHILPEGKTDLPIIRLADVENNPELKRKDSEETDWEINIYTKKHSFLAPIQYQSHEYGVVSDKMWSDGSGTYSPSIHTWIFQTRSPVLSKSLVADLVKRYGLVYKGGEFIEIYHPDFDILIIHDIDDVIEIFTAKGKAVIHIKYYGDASIETLIKVTSDYVSDLTTTYEFIF
ncbi:MAG: DUF2812 domain-containing protein [Dethiosulfatibacter sp.]|nr:DUF2812 domain-containing protein [Dethiosulfatibacter sp.]